MGLGGPWVWVGWVQNSRLCSVPIPSNENWDLGRISSPPDGRGKWHGPGWELLSNQCLQPSRRLFKITSRDFWQVFLDHARVAPVPNLCCCCHQNRVCNKACSFQALHITLTGDQTSALGKWVEFCRARMLRQPADAAKKPKQVGNP
jgi:hypothetical protein